jgi:hypothetical protein
MTPVGHASRDQFGKSGQSSSPTGHMGAV